MSGSQLHFEFPYRRDIARLSTQVLTCAFARLFPSKCIHLTETFDHKNHVCIVFELLGSSVFDFLKSNDFIPFPIAHIQDFAKQLLTSVACASITPSSSLLKRTMLISSLRRSDLHRMRLVHTDLKPENILLADSSSKLMPGKVRISLRISVRAATDFCLSLKRPGQMKRRVLENTDIRLIDFGSATFEEEYHSTVVSTRHYRAPEIILGKDLQSCLLYVQLRNSRLFAFIRCLRFRLVVSL